MPHVTKGIYTKYQKWQKKKSNNNQGLSSELAEAWKGPPRPWTFRADLEFRCVLFSARGLSVEAEEKAVFQTSVGVVASTPTCGLDPGFTAAQVLPDTWPRC